jgi:hypothetical protein
MEDTLDTSSFSKSEMMYAVNIAGICKEKWSSAQLNHKMPL